MGQFPLHKSTNTNFAPAKLYRATHDGKELPSRTALSFGNQTSSLTNTHLVIFKLYVVL